MKLFTGHLFGLFLFLTLVASLAFAECSVSSLTTSAISATQVGNSVTVTVTYSGSSCTGQQLYLDVSSGLTADQAYKTLGSDSGSETFSISASIAGSYSYNARLSTTTSTPATIQFVSPSVLTIDSSSNPSTASGKALNSGFTLTITINNPSAASITSSYSFTYDSSSISLSGTSTSASLTIASSESATLTWTVTPTTYFSSKTISFNLGSTSGAFTSTVSTVSAPASSSSSDSSSSKSKSPYFNEPNVTNKTAQDTSITSNTSGDTETPLPPDVGNKSDVGSTVVSPPVVSNEIPVSKEQTDAYSAISALQKKVSQLKDQGYDVSSVQKTLSTALDAYNAGNYVLALSLANQASAATGSLPKVSTEAVTPPSAQPPQDYSLAIVAILAVIIIVALYMLFKGGKGKKSYK